MIGDPRAARVHDVVPNRDMTGTCEGCCGLRHQSFTAFS